MLLHIYVISFYCYNIWFVKYAQCIPYTLSNVSFFDFSLILGIYYHFIG